MLPALAGYRMLAELAEVPIRPDSAAALPGRLVVASSLLKKRFSSEVTVLTRVIVPAKLCIEVPEEALAFRFLELAVK